LWGNVDDGKRLITVLSNVGHGQFLSFETILLNTFVKILLLEPWTLLHHFECIHNLWYLLIVIKKQQNVVQIIYTLNLHNRNDFNCNYVYLITILLYVQAAVFIIKRNTEVISIVHVHVQVGMCECHSKVKLFKCIFFAHLEFLFHNDSQDTICKMAVYENITLSV